MVDSKISLEEACQRLKDNDFSLQQLDLSDRSIGDAGALALSFALKKNSVLKELHLGNTGLSVAGVTKLAGSLKSHNKTLERLFLQSNPEVGDKGAEALSSIFLENRTLRTLNMARCNIGDVGASALGEALRTEHAPLFKLYLYGNSIANTGASALAEVIMVNNTLQELFMWDNNIGQPGLEDLRDAFNQNGTKEDGRKLQLKVDWEIKSEKKKQKNKGDSLPKTPVRKMRKSNLNDIFQARSDAIQDGDNLATPDLGSSINFNSNGSTSNCLRKVSSMGNLLGSPHKNNLAEDLSKKVKDLKSDEPISNFAKLRAQAQALESAAANKKEIKALRRSSSNLSNDGKDKIATMQKCGSIRRLQESLCNGASNHSTERRKSSRKTKKSNSIRNLRENQGEKSAQKRSSKEQNTKNGMKKSNSMGNLYGSSHENHPAEDLGNEARDLKSEESTSNFAKLRAKAQALEISAARKKESKALSRSSSNLSNDKGDNNAKMQKSGSIRKLQESLSNSASNHSTERRKSGSKFKKSNSIRNIPGSQETQSAQENSPAMQITENEAGQQSFAFARLRAKAQEMEQAGNKRKETMVLSKSSSSKSLKELADKVTEQAEDEKEKAMIISNKNLFRELKAKAESLEAGTKYVVSIRKVDPALQDRKEIFAQLKSKAEALEAGPHTISEIRKKIPSPKIRKEMFVQLKHKAEELDAGSHTVEAIRKQDPGVESRKAIFSQLKHKAEELDAGAHTVEAIRNQDPGVECRKAIFSQLKEKVKSANGCSDTFVPLQKHALNSDKSTFPQSTTNIKFEENKIDSDSDSTASKKLLLSGDKFEEQTGSKCVLPVKVIDPTLQNRKEIFAQLKSKAQALEAGPHTILEIRKKIPSPKIRKEMFVQLKNKAEELGARSHTVEAIRKQDPGVGSRKAIFSQLKHKAEDLDAGSHTVEAFRKQDLCVESQKAIFSKSKEKVKSPKSGAGTSAPLQKQALNSDESTLPNQANEIGIYSDLLPSTSEDESRASVGKTDFAQLKANAESLGKGELKVLSINKTQEDIVDSKSKAKAESEDRKSVFAQLKAKAEALENGGTKWHPMEQIQRVLFDSTAEKDTNNGDRKAVFAQLKAKAKALENGGGEGQALESVPDSRAIKGTTAADSNLVLPQHKAKTEAPEKGGTRGHQNQADLVQSKTTKASNSGERNAELMLKVNAEPVENHETRGQPNEQPHAGLASNEDLASRERKSAFAQLKAKAEALEKGGTTGQPQSTTKEYPISRASNAKGRTP